MSQFRFKEYLKKKPQNQNLLGSLIDKSLSFWKNEIKLPSILNPCDIIKHEDSVDEKEVKGEEKIKKNDVFISFKDTKKQDKKKYNDWKPEEDEYLKKLCRSGFHKKWKKIANLIGNKTPRMCAYRLKKLQKNNLRKNHKFKLRSKKVSKNMSIDLENELIQSDLSEYEKTLSDFLNLQISDEEVNTSLFKLTKKKKIKVNSPSVEKNIEVSRVEVSTPSPKSSQINFFNLSYRNSPETTENIEEDFKKAYIKIFQCYAKSDNDREFEQETEYTEKFEKSLSQAFDQIKEDPKENELLNVHDIDKIKEIINSNEESIPEKNIKLSKYLIEINKQYKNQKDKIQIENLMKSQAMILESMIELTKKSKIMNTK